MSPRQRGRHAPVALVGDQDDGARGGDAEVAASDTDIGAQELLAQGAPRERRERLHVVGQLLPRLAGEELADLRLGLVHGGADDVERPLAALLDDELAEIRLRHLGAEGGQRRVELDLLGHHRLGLHDPAGFLAARELDHVVARLLRVRGEEDVAAGALHIGGELGQVLVEVGDGVATHGGDGIPPRLGVAEVGVRPGVPLLARRAW